MKNLIIHCILIASILLSAQNTGCSFIGLGIGTVYDVHNPKGRWFIAGSVTQLVQGTLIDVRLHNRTSYMGIYHDLLNSDEGNRIFIRIIKADHSEMDIPLDSVDSIYELREVKNHDGKKIGFGMGLALDIVMFFILISLFSFDFDMSGGDWGWSLFD